MAGWAIRGSAFLAAIAAAVSLSFGAAAATHITFVTDWKAQAEHGGFYEARALGLYAREGLDVRILEGGPSVNVPQLLAAGAADFGIGSNGFIPLNLLREGAPIKAVMAVFQKDPQVLISHVRADVTSLADMRGKPIMISDASIAAFWPWLKARYHFDDTQIRKYTFNLAPFLVDPKAIQEGYLTSEPYTIASQGHVAARVFLLADYGYPGYANLVLVPQKWIAANPRAVQGFVNATREGWRRYLFADPAPANALIKRDNPEMTDGVIAQAIAKMKSYQLVTSADTQALGIGAMTEARWKVFFETMSSEGLYDHKFPWRSAFDLRFIAGGADGSPAAHR
jgi:NitT/TauT family transport system substrate-binding protein